MEKNKRFLIDKINVKVNQETGECRSLKIAVSKHIEDFFCMYMDAWDDFKESEGTLKTIFTHCILVSKLSRMGNEPEGNVFNMYELIKHTTLKYPDKSPASIRMAVKRLSDRGFVIKTKDRGYYIINPKYGIKGEISDKTYLELTIKANNNRKI